MTYRFHYALGKITGEGLSKHSLYHIGLFYLLALNPKCMIQSRYSIRHLFRSNLRQGTESTLCLEHVSRRRIPWDVAQTVIVIGGYPFGISAVIGTLNCLAHRRRSSEIHLSLSVGNLSASHVDVNGAL